VRIILITLAILASAGQSIRAADFPKFEPQEIDPHVGNVCYAVTVADVNGDAKPDVVAVTEDSVVWFANPTWEKQIIIKGATERDNVCLQAHDIDGDGRVDFALGAAWRPTDTKAGGTLQWLKRDVQGTWKVLPLASEPTLHRIRWGDVVGDGKSHLVVAPLQGRGTKPPNWGDGQGVRILVFTVPKDPEREPWPVEVADESLHTVHNLQITDFDDDGRLDVVLASWEGVFVLKRNAAGRWSKMRVGSGNQDTSPSKGSSEVKVGRFADGRKYIATIEPWHGFQVVAYVNMQEPGALWRRAVVDEPVTWGHAVWCADVDNDGDDELIIGQRDPNKDNAKGTRGPGVWIYDPKSGPSALEFTKHVVDDGGIGTEDLVAADLNADGRLDIVAGGRSSHNVKIYWNRGPSSR
jgi:hypothetical protein